VPPSDTLQSLLARFPPLFPASSPLELIPSAADFAPHERRFPGGHAARWFAACDGQRGDRPFAHAHALCSLAEALDAMRIADDIRAEPDRYWVEPHWLAIASDGAGQHFMIDDHDGRVLAVAHDDDHIQVLGASPEAWLAKLLDDHAQGSVVWDETFGLIEREKLEQVHEFHREQALRHKLEPLPLKHKLGLALTVGLAMGLMGLFAWFLESRR
jgi:hypothetical protein